MKKMIIAIVMTIVGVATTQAQTIQKKVQPNTKVQQMTPLNKTNSVIKKSEREPVTNIKAPQAVPMNNANTVLKRNTAKPLLELTTAKDSFIQKEIQLPFSSVKRKYFVKKFLNYYVLNGDILIEDNSHLQSLMMATITNTKGKDYKWPDARIPIVIDESLPERMVEMVYNAMNQMNKKLELQVIARTNEPDYVRIKYSPDLDGAAGLSLVGRRGNGEQVLWLAESASGATVWHELLHAAGVYHEQGRVDRDKFIKVDSQNIQKVNLYNFQIEESSKSFGPYDYCSIMHYPSFAFAIDASKPTITCKSNGTDVSCPPCMGQRLDFSSGDIAGLDAFYNDVKRAPEGYVFVQTPQPLFHNVTLTGVKVIVDRVEEEYLPVQPFKNSAAQKIPTISAAVPKRNTKIESRISDFQVVASKSQTRNSEVIQSLQPAMTMQQQKKSYSREISKLKEIPNGTSYKHSTMFTEDYLRRYGSSGVRRMAIYANLDQAFLKAFNTALKNESYYSGILDLKTQIGDYSLMSAEYSGSTKTPVAIIVTLPRNSVEVVLSHYQTKNIKSSPKLLITFDLQAFVPVQLPANTSQSVKLGATQISIFNLGYKVGDDPFQIGASLAGNIIPYFRQSAFANELQKNGPLLFASADFANQNLAPIRREGYLLLPSLRIDHAISPEGDLLLIATNKKMVSNRVN